MRYIHMYKDQFVTIHPKPAVRVSDGSPIIELSGKVLPKGTLYHVTSSLWRALPKPPTWP